MLISIRPCSAVLLLEACPCPLPHFQNSAWCWLSLRGPCSQHRGPHTGQDPGVQAGSTQGPLNCSSRSSCPPPHYNQDGCARQRHHSGSLRPHPPSPAIPLRPQTCTVHSPKQSCAVGDSQPPAWLPQGGSANSQLLWFFKTILEALSHPTPCALLFTLPPSKGGVQINAAFSPYRGSRGMLAPCRPVPAQQAGQASPHFALCARHCQARATR